MGRLKNRIPELMTLKELRDKTRYRQRDMAQGTGLTDAAISRILSYETLDNLAYGSALVIAEWLGVSMEELSERE
jgi:transcriptional regulator with XRE-family HTH domain